MRRHLPLACVALVLTAAVCAGAQPGPDDWLRPVVALSVLGRNLTGTPHPANGNNTCPGEALVSEAVQAKAQWNV